MTSQVARQPYFDFLRGFAIIMVVGIHTITDYSPTFDSLEEIATILVRLALNCAVPLFLAISGYFVAKKKLDSPKEHWSFMKKQIPKVYIPCLIFSIPYFILDIHDKDNIMRSLAYLFLCGFSIYYFVALIIQYYIILPFLTKINNRGGVIITCILSIISIVILTYLMKVLDLHPPLIIYAGPFPLWIVFFFMGIYFSRHSRNYRMIWPLIVIIIGFVLQILEYKYWLDRGQVALGIKLSSFIFSFGVMWLLFSRKVESKYTDNILIKSINWIGGISFGIYLLHCYMIMVTDRLFPGISWAFKWLFVLSLTILIIWISKLIFPKISNKYLGFR